MASEMKSSMSLTYKHYVCFPDDGQRHEVIDGDHYANPAPSTYHQTVSRRIQFMLYSQIELTGLGVVYNAPVDLQLGDHNIFQPDIVVITASRESIVTPTKIKGVSDMVIEILSPTSVRNDCELKRNVYEQAGVSEYWIVDLFEHQIDQLVLDDRGEYQSMDHQSSLSLSFLKDISVDPKKVW